MLILKFHFQKPLRKFDVKQSVAIIVVLLGISTGIAASSPVKHQEIELRVTEKGFEPSEIDVKPGTNVTLKITRMTESTCATAIQIQSKKISKDLPLNKTVKLELGKLEKGEIRFACGMDMVSGKIIVQ
jgi:plastocyanin domain-containing protein